MSGLVFVGAANECRSCLAEMFTRAALDRRFGMGPELIGVSSAGLLARPGRPIWAPAAFELARRGLMFRSLTARRLTREDVRDADLVLCVGRQERDHVREVVPSSAAHVYTLLELAWLLERASPGEVPGLTPAERLAVMPLVAVARSGRVSPPAQDAFDLADPMHGDPRGVATVSEVIEWAAQQVVNLL
jgi:protein-tyrosine-phosphatase